MADKKVCSEGIIPLNKECTVFQAEIEAMRQAAQYLIQIARTKRIKYMKIFSDSMSGLQALDAGHITSKLVLATIKTLNQLAGNIDRVSLCCIKAHVGHDGNKIADNLAKTATPMVHLSEIPRASTISKNYIKSKLYEMLSEQWRAKKHVDRLTYSLTFQTKIEVKSF